MVGARRPVVQPPRHTGLSIDGHWLLGFLQILIVIAALVGVVAAIAMEENNLAIMIGLVGGALIAGKLI